MPYPRYGQERRNERREDANVSIDMEMTDSTDNFPCEFSNVQEFVTDIYHYNATFTGQSLASGC